MRIIHINTSLENGGLENMMVDIANNQAQLGHTVAIIIINNYIENSIKKRINPCIKTFFLCRKAGSTNLQTIFKIINVLFKTRQYDVIHCHAQNIGQYLKYISRIPRILTVHAFKYDIAPLKHYNKIVAISNAVYEDIFLRSSIKPALIYNGINSMGIRKKTDWSQKELIKIVQVSRLDHENKGQDVLLKAMKVAIDRNTQIKFSLDFIGDGKSKGFLTDLVNSLNLSKVVNFLGNKTREWVYENLASYDIFVQASRFEGFGLTVAEAIAAKVPVIVAQNDGPAEIINNGEFGFIFENGNYFDLCNKILEVSCQITNNKSQPLVENAYKYCINNFDIRFTVANYLSLYKKVIKQ